MIMVFFKMVIFQQVLALVSRPLLIPVTVAGVGFWYGTYDLSYIAAKMPLALIVRKSKSSSKPKGIARHIFSLGCGIGIVVGRNMLAPATTAMEFDYSSIPKLFRSMKNALPIRYHIITIGISGATSGLVLAIYDSLRFD
jgi:hypothetical protein